jgi:GH35 family endo-1,4-beta-xylanase
MIRFIRWIFRRPEMAKHEPRLAVAYVEGDPPPAHIRDRCAVVFDGGAAKMPAVVDADGNYAATRLKAQGFAGQATDEHCWVWLKDSQLVRYDLERLKARTTRMQDIGRHIQAMIDLPRSEMPRRVDLVNEALSPNKGEIVKQHPILDEEVSFAELAEYFAFAQRKARGVRFCLNEWGLEWNDDRVDRFLTMFKMMHTAHPMDEVIVGFQAHLKAGQSLAPWRRICRDLQAAGIAMYVTELDIEGTEAEQTAIAREVMKIVREFKIEQVTVWHWRDKNHWKPGCAPFDENGQPKPWAKVIGLAR